MKQIRICRVGLCPFRIPHSLFWLGATLLGFSGSVARGADPFAEGVRPTEPLTPEEQRKTFHLPPGFEIQLVANEPDINKPMNMQFDARGRLWVTTSIEYPWAAPTNRLGRDRLMVFEDFGPDGRARKVTQFADELNVPIGVYPHADGAIVWSIPNIWFLRDTDGDGKCDRREVLYGPFDYTRDTHGNQASFRRGFDGWLYATHGFNNDSHVKGRDGHEIHLNSGNTYRFQVDGARLEQHTWGQVNPYGLAWDPLGNLYSSDCHTAPTYQLLAGGYYPSFGKPHDGLGFAPTLMEHSHGSTAIDGMIYYADDLWPEEFRDNIFVGNVMTSRINRDRLSFHGSSPKAHELPDLLTTDDPWFRPVDNQLGPDGALYVADFYNRIIGHYEVPLTHPGRDRERGRIWRVVYKGSQPANRAEALDSNRLRPIALPQDLDELLRELDSPSLSRRLLATQSIYDRHGKKAVPRLASAISSPSGVHALWLLYRLGGMQEAMLNSVAGSQNRNLRVHAMRIVTDMLHQATLQKSPDAPNVSIALRLARAGLDDPDALVQRCAVEALSEHPAPEHISLLLALRHRVSEADAHLVYVVRKGLRDQLKPPGAVQHLGSPRLSEKDAAAIADVALAIPSSDAGNFLLQYVQQYPADKEALGRYLGHVARHVSDSGTDTIAGFARARFPSDLDFQLGLIKSVQQGIVQRGGRLSITVLGWGFDLASQLLRLAEESSLDWINTPVPQAAIQTNPWVLNKRPSSDGDDTSLFLCSLPPGGERLTGTLRSKTFALPATLRFFIAGHNGYPGQASHDKNLVRLRAADGEKVLAQALAPRNDLAQPFKWDLSGHQGTQGYLEIVDGDAGDAYAWVAVGRFEPAVVALPATSPNAVPARQQAAADLARTFPLPKLEPKLTELLLKPTTDLDVCTASARALAAFNPNHVLAALAPLAGEPAVPAELRSKVKQVLARRDQADARRALTEVMQFAPARLQLRLAQSLAGSTEGAEALLKMVEDKQASPRLLVERSVQEKLAAAISVDVEARIKRLTDGISPAAAESQKLIDAKRATYDPLKTKPSRGLEVFTQSCQLCHQIDGTGNLVGPQLDGIGNRGLERVLEDILDPNRNVDPAFQSTILVLKEGDVISGLVRRQEGETLVLADSTGKEISVPKSQVVERRASTTSLMPENFGEIIPPEDLNHLLAYLLSKANKQAPTP